MSLSFSPNSAVFAEKQEPSVQPLAPPKRNRPGTKNEYLFSWNFYGTTTSQSTSTPSQSESSSSEKRKKKKSKRDESEEDEKRETEEDTDADIPVEDDSNSNFASQELIQKMIQQDAGKVERIISLPETSNQEQDQDAWIYEHMRQFLLELNHFIIAHAEVCTRETQPEMKITGVKSGEELVFLSPAFNPPQAVPAIDYMIQILTQATQTLNDTKIFPNRISVSKKGMKEIKTLTRRLYRLFAFSYFVHPEQWQEFEKVTHLSERYQKFLKMYDLMPKKQFLIPGKCSAASNFKNKRERLMRYETESVQISSPNITPISKNAKRPRFTNLFQLKLGGERRNLPSWEPYFIGDLGNTGQNSRVKFSSNMRSSKSLNDCSTTSSAVIYVKPKDEVTPHSPSSSLISSINNDVFSESNKKCSQPTTVTPNSGPCVPFSIKPTPQVPSLQEKQKDSQRSDVTEISQSLKELPKLESQNIPSIYMPLKDRISSNLRLKVGKLHYSDLQMSPATPNIDGISLELDIPLQESESDQLKLESLALSPVVSPSSSATITTKSPNGLSLDIKKLHVEDIQKSPETPMVDCVPLGMDQVHDEFSKSSFLKKRDVIGFQSSSGSSGHRNINALEEGNDYDLYATPSTPIDDCTHFSNEISIKAVNVCEENSPKDDYNGSGLKVLTKGDYLLTYKSPKTQGSKSRSDEFLVRALMNNKI